MENDYLAYLCLPLVVPFAPRSQLLAASRQARVSKGFFSGVRVWNIHQTQRQRGSVNLTQTSLAQSTLYWLHYAITSRTPKQRGQSAVTFSFFGFGRAVGIQPPSG
jgi:hypothetical protein